MVSKRIQIGVYFGINESSGKYRFEFLVDRELPNTLFGYELVRTLRAPLKYEEVFALALKQKSPFHLGGIQYIALGKGRVASFDYYPKEYLRLNTQNSGLGAFLELLAVHHLRKLGITSVETTYSPSDRRLKQLDKAGLKKGEPYSPKDWLRGIANVVRVGKKPQFNRPILR